MSETKIIDREEVLRIIEWYYRKFCYGVRCEIVIEDKSFLNQEEFIHRPQVFTGVKVIIDGKKKIYEVKKDE